jgi:hypothetical protein
MLTSGIFAILYPTDSDMPLKDILLERMRNEFRTGVGEELSVLLQDSLCGGRAGIESLLRRHGWLVDRCCCTGETGSFKARDPDLI